MVSKRNRAAPLAWKDMIFAAIADLKDRTGSSRVAIGRWILANFATSEDKVTLLLNRTLKREVEKGTLVQVKQSFKLSPDTKKALAKVRFYCNPFLPPLILPSNRLLCFFLYTYNPLIPQNYLHTPHQGAIHMAYLLAGKGGGEEGK